MSDIEYVVVMHDGSRSTKFMSEAYCKDLMEQLAAAQSQEVCTVAHDNVETCGYCQRDALAARLAEAEREADLYHTAMESLRSTKMKHGLCQPRERMACTHCNAVDRLDAMLAAYKGRRLVASLTGAAVSAGDVDGSR